MSSLAGNQTNRQQGRRSEADAETSYPQGCRNVSALLHVGESEDPELVVAEACIGHSGLQVEDAGLQHWG